ncbi:MAG: sigma-70 family RNA polymerase sigma factor [Gemmatimonadetes bacterium]|nr:sigma-70 family RNA polymerase sigma factor [Gemmatimonadota bacterium]
MASTTTSGAAGATGVDDPGFAAQIRERDVQALEEVVRRYLAQILRAARGAGLPPQLAEDVAQDTFVTFIETAHRFEGRSHVRTWLFGILYKKIAPARRGLLRDHEMDDIEEVFEQRFDAAGSWIRPPRPVDAEVYDAEVRQGISGCLDRVPTNQRMAFVLREIEGMDTQEICKILEVTRTNVGVLLHRVRNRLRECLEAKGMEP